MLELVLKMSRAPAPGMNWLAGEGKAELRRSKNKLKEHGSVIVPAVMLSFLNHVQQGTFTAFMVIWM